MNFNLVSKYKPAGDQIQAIKKLSNNFQKGINKQVLLGVTGSGKTFTIANVIQNTQLPTLIISHNKTLAAQLYQEFKELFPQNKVSYFVSYYDYYQPEAYIPSSDTYIQKEVQINDLIDKLRLQASTNLFSGSDNIVIASVSCIYNIGDPSQFGAYTKEFFLNKSYPRQQLFKDLVKLYYSRSELEFSRSSFRVRGNTIDIWPSYMDDYIQLEFDNDILKSITQLNPFTARHIQLEKFLLYPAKQYVTGNENLPEIIAKIHKDKEKQIKFFKSQNKILEANRISQRVNYDMEMLQEIGYINGIENYSIYFEKNRHSGQPPYTLIDYFQHLYGQKFLTVIDESHVTIPQIGGMYAGDLARKNNLIDFGFRLPTALDNRPLKFEEFYSRIPNCIYVSATPADYEIKASNNIIVEQIIRPTGLLDPKVEIRSEKNQIPNLTEEIKKRIAKKQRTLLITLTKKMAEELSDFLSKDFKVAYLHSDIETLKRTDILDQLRKGDFDVLVGINLLREGLDLPEVSLIVILDAGQQGFLRSKTSLIQIMGRAARHIDGQVIMYTDYVSTAMKEAIQEVNRRRKIQETYNQKHNIIPQTIEKSYRPKLIEEELSQKETKIDFKSLLPSQRKKYLSSMKKQMHQFAADLNFEEAIKIRDQLRKLEK